MSNKNPKKNDVPETLKPKEVIWVAHCKTCGVDVYTASNGVFVEAFARIHKYGGDMRNGERFEKHTFNHTVLVGFEV